jgi:hypothetical protein
MYINRNVSSVFMIIMELYCFLPGYGIYLNSSSDLTYLNGCLIQENGADGIRFVHHDELADVNFDRTKTADFCTFPITASQTFPIPITVEQNKYAPAGRECSKVCCS